MTISSASLLSGFSDFLEHFSANIYCESKHNNAF